MFNYKRLQDRYHSDPAFNRMTNLFRQMIEEYGLTPSEIREGLFLAQYQYELGNVKKYIYSQHEQERAAELLIQLRENFILDAEEIMNGIKS